MSTAKGSDVTGDPSSVSGCAASSRRAGWLPVSAAKAEQLTCPVLTLQNKSIEELTNQEVPDIRAYKLGKKRWSYNQFELRVHNEGGDNTLEVKEALQSCTPATLQRVKDSAASYKVRLTNNFYVVAHVFIVYETALEVRVNDSKHGPQNFYQWICVDRSACKKGCDGPVLRPIQRFGRVGKRTGPDAPRNQAGQLKNYKYMYLSLDEAGTHVGGSRFRLLFAVYDTTGTTLLGTTVSTPIRVLANNDVPTGAAHVGIDVTLRSDWVGWYNVCPVTLKPLPAMPVGSDGGSAASDDDDLEEGNELQRAIRSAAASYRSAGGETSSEAGRLAGRASPVPGSLGDELPVPTYDNAYARRSRFGATTSPDLLAATAHVLPQCISPGDSSYSSLTQNGGTYGGGASGHGSPASLHLQPVRNIGREDDKVDLHAMLRQLSGAPHGAPAAPPQLLDLGAGLHLRPPARVLTKAPPNKRARLDADPVALNRLRLHAAAVNAAYGDADAGKAPPPDACHDCGAGAPPMLDAGGLASAGNTPLAALEALGAGLNLFAEEWGSGTPTLAALAAGLGSAGGARGGGGGEEMPHHMSRLHELAATLDVDLGLNLHELASGGGCGVSGGGTPLGGLQLSPHGDAFAASLLGGGMRGNGLTSQLSGLNTQLSAGGLNSQLSGLNSLLSGDWAGWGGSDGAAGLGHHG